MTKTALLGLFGLLLALLGVVFGLPPFVEWIRRLFKRLTPKIIKRSMSKFTMDQVEKMKSSTKYIPEVFMEIDDLKENARYFTDPVLFWQKAIEDIDRLDFRFLNKLIGKFDLPAFEIELPRGFRQKMRLSKIDEKGSELISFLQRKITELEYYGDKNIENKIPEDKRFLFEELRHSFQFIALYQSKLEDVLECVDLFTKKVLFITSRAGQGKTNFICDFAENVLLKKKQLSLFIAANALNYSELDIENVIYKKTIKSSFKGDFRTVLQKAGALCKKEFRPFVIMIDGLNENSDIDVFSKGLEDFIEHLMEFDSVRIILTCRTEYFEQRFSNFKYASFANKIAFIDRVHSRMNKVKRKRLLKTYLRFFNIYYEGMSKDVFEQLTDDSLLLRFFCEAYGDHQSNKKINMPHLYDIYKENLFRTYFETKSKKIGERIQDTFFKTKAKRLLNKIIIYMIENRVFVDIPVSEVASGNNDFGLLNKMLEEDMILRKDLGKTKVGISNGKSEVVNFTFDEFRDYWLSDYLIVSIFAKNRNKFEKLIDELIDSNSPVAEGISKYLFHISKRANYDSELKNQLDNQKLARLIEQKHWYDEIFIESILSTDDAFIMKCDLDKVREKFMENIKSSSFIIVALIRRYDTEGYKNLNIGCLLRILRDLDESEYRNLVNPVFDDVDHWWSHSRDTQYWPIDSLTNDLRNVLHKDVLEDNLYLHNVFEFLIFLFSLRNSHETRKLYEDYGMKYPKIAVQRLINNVSAKNRVVVMNIWTILAYLSENEQGIPDNFCSETIKKIMKEKPDPKTENEESEECIFQFLRVVLQKQPKTFSEQERGYITSHIEFTESTPSRRF